MGSVGYARDSKKDRERGFPGNAAQFSGRFVTEKCFDDKIFHPTMFESRRTKIVSPTIVKSFR